MSNQKNLTELWWDDEGWWAVFDVLSENLSDEDALFVFELAELGPGPYVPAELASMLDEFEIENEQKGAFNWLIDGGFLVKTSDGNLIWSDEIKKKARAASLVPVPDGWFSKDNATGA